MDLLSLLFYLYSFKLQVDKIVSEINEYSSAWLCVFRGLLSPYKFGQRLSVPCEPSTTPHGITHSSQGVAPKVACHCGMNFIPFRESLQQDLFHSAWSTTTYYLLTPTYHLLLTTSSPPYKF